jgi:hypothetical protein
MQAVARLFKGKTLKIHSIDRVEIAVELDFDLITRKVFSLELEFDPEGLEEDDYSRAQHCLVVLLGGKRVMIEPELALREQWGRRSEVPARVFLVERTFGRPIGHTEGLPGHLDPVLEVAPFYNSLYPAFDVQDVKAVLNGRGGRRG